MAEITMRAANVVRHIEWSNGDGDGTEFYAVELFGETGELLNVVKKLVREELGMVGSRATHQDLAEELADVVICVDLLAMAYNMPVARAAFVGGLLDERSNLTVAIEIGRVAGEIMEWVLDIENDELKHQWPRDALMSSMEELNGFVGALADRYQIDLRSAVVNKFNKTSAKYGLSTMMAPEASLI